MNVFEGYRKYFLVQSVVVRGHCERKQSRLEARGNTQKLKTNTVWQSNNAEPALNDSRCRDSS